MWGLVQTLNTPRRIQLRIVGYPVPMGQIRSHQPPSAPSPTLERLAREGVVRLPTRSLAEVLAARGPLRGPVTDAGTRALQELRGERV